ncbi:MAG TPA: D-alanine--D-alanine ligase family protein [Candidatus Saccharimonadales bacterium]|nr:D-alanine--D-alanine ligase family protein [Candidatus Saccharimonadales bacterium]
MPEPVKVGVFFGSRSVEHEVSVITAQQAMAAMPSERMIPVPVYIAKSGAWYTGAPLLQLERYKDIDRLIASATRVTMRPEPGTGGELTEVDGRRGLLGGSSRSAARFDVAMPLVHGSNGEDGTLQGLFELANVPYCGCDVASAAVSMDKRLARTTLRGAGLPVLDDVAVARARWLENAGAVCAELESSPGYPMYVKPLRLGSSIGVSRVETREQLDAALDLAFRYDTSILAEAAQDGIVEINCSVLGHGDDLEVSVCEQPTSNGTLSYADKYLSGGKGKGGAKASATGMKSARRVIPAPLSAALTRRIQEAAKAAFRAIGAAGVARVDFLVLPDRDSFLINELNTLPGSLSFYLWEASGMTFQTLLIRLVEMATARQREREATTSSIDTWLLTGRPG